MTGLPFPGARLAALLLLLGAAASGPHIAQSFARTPALTAASIDAILTAQDQDSHADLRGIVILKNGRQLAERYYHDAVGGQKHHRAAARNGERQRPYRRRQ
ncbi:hypothetical protein [Sphingopyxis sp. MWB1]|uniref:hypothetical protein n=1 Tax=Sphingopyxis sp. MWB1 TaxID=1537715 RepID=UPI000AE9DA06|nr:hypothetical protein [Sphingopyxis sp. MWB1]